jgi:hypothetical protein
MTIFQKSLILATISGVGFGSFKAYQVSLLGEQVRSLHQQCEQLTTQVAGLRRERDAATSQLVSRALTGKQSDPDYYELLRLRGEIAQLRSSERNVTPEERSIRFMSEQVTALKGRLDRMPELKIPELQLVTDKDWAEAVWDADLNTDDGVREALSKLRDRSVNSFFNVLRPALKQYMNSNGGSLPVNLSELREVIQPSFDDSVFERYSIRQTGQLSSDPSKTLVELIAHVDEDYDSNHEMTMNGASGGRYNRTEGLIQAAAETFIKNNNGQTPTAPEQLKPYLSKNFEPATERKYLARISSSH